VLCHGLGGFSNLGLLHYFKGVKKALEDIGCNVLVPEVSMTASIDSRAAQVRDAITSKLQASGAISPGSPKPRVHLVGQWLSELIESWPHRSFLGHSMGGLDSRRLVHFPGLRFKVLSITTVGTPHRGSPVANLLATPSQCRCILTIVGTR
jgi:triacylglycerol lipase